MPGNFRYGYDIVANELKPLVEKQGPRLKAVMIFGVMDKEAKDPQGNCFN